MDETATCGHAAREEKTTMADRSANNQHDTPGDAAHGGPLRDACGHGMLPTLGVSTGVRARSWSTRDGGLVPIFLDTSAPGHLCHPCSGNSFWALQH